MSESSSFIDYYELLGVPANAEIAEIRNAFIRLAREHHPDVGGSTEMMQQITAAYRTLMSATSRKAYDLLHDFHTGKSGVEYHGQADDDTGQIDDLTDDEIDDFLDTIFAEYHNQPQPKKSLYSRFRNML